MSTEANSRIKIDQLLKEAGWRFFDDNDGQANIQLEQGVTITRDSLDELGDDFEKTSNGRIDYLLLDNNKFPMVVLEAKRSSINPLDGKEQAREYADGKGVRYIILSNGDLHFFWDKEEGNPIPIRHFPNPNSFESLRNYNPDPNKILEQVVEDTYVAKTMRYDFENSPAWIDENTRSQFIKDTGIMILRQYQLGAVRSIQDSIKAQNNRFLFEMATGTGKTLIAAAVIKLFLRSSNAKRVLFLVDRLELEDQGYGAFVKYLKNDYHTVIYKDSKNDWNNAEIVVSTVQSLTDKYQMLFSPTDFDLVISDEAHRSINGNARALLEYFAGYKLGLTATPRDYLKNLGDISSRDPREMERREMLDTYKIFQCDSGIPTFKYSLIDGVKDGFLIEPFVIDARTDITTQLLSDKGYSVQVEDEDHGGLKHEIFTKRHFERKFYSDETNQSFCETFIKNALRDPISGEIGKGIIFCVSQDHASRVTQILNEIAHREFPGMYNSDFAMQITSNISGAQQSTINFKNNNLKGRSRFIENYKSSKVRVCVTVGMMTTGYDCPDLLNLGLMRPIFSPSDFVQIKGRGTRTHTFVEKYRDEQGEMQQRRIEKETFKVFDFFANFQYFEEEFNYDEELELPKITGTSSQPGLPRNIDEYTNLLVDPIKEIKDRSPGGKHWKIDYKYWSHFEDELKGNEEVIRLINEGNMSAAVDYVKDNILDKPDEYYNLDNLRKAVSTDRKPTLREMIEFAMGVVPHLKSKDEKLNEEVDKFLSIFNPDPEQVVHIRNFIKAYISDENLRDIIESKEYGKLATSIVKDDFKALKPEWREQIPKYVNDNISIKEYS